MVPERFYKVYEQALKFRKEGFNVLLKPQTDKKAIKIVENYTDDMKKILYEECKPFLLTNQQNYQIKLIDNDRQVYEIDHMERLNSMNFNYFYNWKCENGFKSISISPSPDKKYNVYRGYACFDKPLGNLHDGFVLHRYIKKCITDKKCLCTADSKIPKYKY
jgi:hypothetical protein